MTLVVDGEVGNGLQLTTGLPRLAIVAAMLCSNMHRLSGLCHFLACAN